MSKRPGITCSVDADSLRDILFLIAELNHINQFLFSVVVDHVLHTDCRLIEKQSHHAQVKLVESRIVYHLMHVLLLKNLHQFEMKLIVSFKI